MRPELVAQINVHQLARNVRALRAAARPGTRICAALKANAYGHGVEQVIPTLAREGVELAAVSCLDEALQARRLGWDRTILCLGQPLAIDLPPERRERIDAFVRHDLAATISRVEDARDLSDAAVAAGRKLDVHIEVDTGMGRMGLLPDAAEALCREVLSLRGLTLRGLFMHFCNAELPDAARCVEQLTALRALLQRLERRARLPECVHVANSSAALRGIGPDFDIVRVGLALYGYHPDPGIELPDGVRPILRLASHLLLVKELPPHHPIGYGATFVTDRSMRVGVVPVGYADGYLRCLSNRAVMTVLGRPAPVLGRVSMDLTTIDLSAIPEAQTGTPVIVLDERPEQPNSVESIARLAGTIPYEVTCLLGNRVHRAAVDAFEPEWPTDTDADVTSDSPAATAATVTDPSASQSPRLRLVVPAPETVR